MCSFSMGERQKYNPVDSLDTQLGERENSKRVDRFCVRLLNKFGRGEFALRDVYKIFNKIFGTDIVRSKGKFEPSANFEQFRSTIRELLEKQMLTRGAEGRYVVSDFFVERYEQHVNPRDEDGADIEDTIDDGDQYSSKRGFKTFSPKSKSR